MGQYSSQCFRKEKMWALKLYQYMPGQVASNQCRILLIDTAMSNNQTNQVIINQLLYVQSFVRWQQNIFTSFKIYFKFYCFQAFWYYFLFCGNTVCWFRWSAKVLYAFYCTNNRTQIIHTENYSIFFSINHEIRST